ncbi:hypothetical protein H2204_003289 [Knufia peltigerae]|uniref:Uncharacterized protein n=1 Tax=Knufia peltigerae TaxID=1002370 RepID=A0AA38YA36_9EURO|nr:hypothetical protein H2204_003289 [Knufia peltigerae]
MIETPLLKNGFAWAAQLLGSEEALVVVDIEEVVALPSVVVVPRGDVIGDWLVVVEDSVVKVDSVNEDVLSGIVVCVTELEDGDVDTVVKLEDGVGDTVLVVGKSVEGELEEREIRGVVLMDDDEVFKTVEEVVKGVCELGLVGAKLEEVDLVL